LDLALDLVDGIIGHRNEIFSELGGENHGNQGKTKSRQNKNPFFGVFVFYVIIKA